MIFPTRVNEIPCQCEVLEFSPEIPMKVYGPGMEDASPPEEGDFTFQLLDSKGKRATWLDRYVTPAVEAALLEEFLIARTAEKYAIEY